MDLVFQVLSGRCDMQNIPEIDELIKVISKLPGLGPKSAKRIILKLINNREEILKPAVLALTVSKIDDNNRSNKFKLLKN